VEVRVSAEHSLYALFASRRFKVIPAFCHIHYNVADIKGERWRIGSRQAWGIGIGAFVGAVLGGIVGRAALGPGIGIYVGIVLGAALGVAIGGALGRRYNP
jgi:hypothetical protein